MASLQSLTLQISNTPAPVVNVTSPPGEPPTINVAPPDLTAVSTSLATLAECVCPALNNISQAIATASTQAPPPQPIDLSGLIKAIKEVYSDTAANQQIIDEALKLGTISPGLAQASAGSFKVSWDPGRFYPKIAKWLNEAGELPTEASNEMSDVLARLFTSVAHWLQHAAVPFLEKVAKESGNLGSTISESFSGLFSIASKLETDLPKVIFEWVLNKALPPGGVTADSVEDDAFSLLGSAFIVGQAIHLLAEFAGTLKYPASSVFANNAALLVDLLGFGEIIKSFHGVFYPIAIRERARQRYNKAYAPYIPNHEEAFTAFARGKITKAERDVLLQLSGRDAAYVAQEQAVHYRPISPFMLARGFRNRIPPPHVLSDVITDQGVDPAMHDLLEQIIIDSCYQNLEQGLENKLLAAAGKGVMTLEDAISRVRALGWDDRAINLVKQAALIDQQEIIVADVRREVMDGIKSGGMTEEQGRSLLQAAGAADWYIEHTVSLARAENAMRVAERIESEELRTEHRALDDTMRALEAQYLAGNLSLTGFTAAAEAAWALLGEQYAGLGATPAQVQQLQVIQQLSIAATVARLQAQQQGRMVHVYGLTLDQPAAQLLREQVASAKEIFVRGDTTSQATLARLQSLGLPDAWTTALLAQWTAQAAKKGSLAG
jgi:hypothetical protein